MEISGEYVICVENEGYAASLEVKKVYRALRDGQAEAYQMLRVIDESGEDYLYPENYFAPIELPQPAKALFVVEAS